MTSDTKEQATEAEEKPEQDEPPEWLPSNFLSPEELVKSYKESQAHITRISQQLSEMTHENDRLSVEIEALLHRA